jgi:hypothetical protein
MIDEIEMGHAYFKYYFLYDINQNRIRHAPNPGSVIPGTEMQGSVIDLLWPIAGVHRI